MDKMRLFLLVKRVISSFTIRNLTTSFCAIQPVYSSIRCSSFTNNQHHMTYITCSGAAICALIHCIPLFMNVNKVELRWKLEQCSLTRLLM